jgi:hypothetical protein
MASILRFNSSDILLIGKQTVNSEKFASQWLGRVLEKNIERRPIAGTATTRKAIKKATMDFGI